MRACPSCYALNQDDALFCAECQAAITVNPAPAGKEPSEKAALAASARRRYIATPIIDLTAQQWYNACKHFPEVARRASLVSHRPLADVGPHNPLDRTSQCGPLFRGMRFTRMREPGEDEEELIDNER
jgi:hypothetical protein